MVFVGFACAFCLRTPTRGSRSSRRLLAHAAKYKPFRDPPLRPPALHVACFVAAISVCYFDRPKARDVIDAQDRERSRDRETRALVANDDIRSFELAALCEFEFVGVSIKNQ